MTSEQRYTIYVLLQTGMGKKEIASAIKVHKSTVYREIGRNSSESRNKYHYKKAQEMCNERKERLRRGRTITKDVKDEVIRLLREEQWSPKQVSGSLLRSKGVHISHETIYRMIRKDKHEGGDLYKNCRHCLKYRRRSVGANDAKARNIPGRLGIEKRPAEADGTRFGDWEMDLIVDAMQKNAILTMCERKTNMLLMCRLKDGKNADGVASAVVKMLFPYRQYVKTITTDNGSEFCRHAKITAALRAKVYFTDPYSSWQKGAIENTNKLIRQYLPKGSDFNDFSDAYIKQVQYKINRRPREKLRFSTPKDEFFKYIS